MKWILFLSAIGCFTYGMDIERGSLAIAVEGDRLTELAISFFFKDNDCPLRRDIRPIIKKHMDKLRDSEDDEYIKIMNTAGHVDPSASMSRKRHRRSIKQHKDMKGYLDKVVLNSLKEYSEEKELIIEMLEDQSRRKACRERIAIGVSIVSIIASITIAVIPNVTG